MQYGRFFLWKIFAEYLLTFLLVYVTFNLRTDAHAVKTEASKPQTLLSILGNEQTAYLLVVSPTYKTHVCRGDLMYELSAVT